MTIHFLLRLAGSMIIGDPITVTLMGVGIYKTTENHSEWLNRAWAIIVSLLHTIYCIIVLSISIT